MPSRGRLFTSSLNLEVLHETADDKDDEMIAVHDKPCKIVILLRCATFRASRGSVVPSPTATFDVVQDIVASWQRSTRLMLPSLQDCVEAEAKLPVE